MKVILLQDVAKLGKKFSIVVVPDGFGINKLIPKGLAKPATPENIKAVQQRAFVYAHEAATNQEEFAKLKAALAGKSISVPAEANEEGRLFQALKPERIATAIAAATGAHLSAVAISSNEPIKSVGEHTVKLSHGTAIQELTITVVAE